MVAAVRHGRSLREVARQFRVSPDTVLHWVQLATGQRLDRVDWSDRSRAPRHPPRTAAAIEESILAVRRELEQSSDLGFHGAEAMVRFYQLRRREPTEQPLLKQVTYAIPERGFHD